MRRNIPLSFLASVLYKTTCTLFRLWRYSLWSLNMHGGRVRKGL